MSDVWACMYLPPMHFTSFPAVKSYKTNVQTMHQVYLCYILGYTSTSCEIPFHTNLCFDTKISYLSLWQPNVFGGVTCIHQVPMHIASHPGVKVEKIHCAEHASDIHLYTSISNYILVYDVSYNLISMCHAAICLLFRHRQAMNDVLKATAFLKLHALHKLADCLADHGEAERGGE